MRQVDDVIGRFAEGVANIAIQIIERLVSLSSEKKESIIQFVKFCIVGVTNTAISYLCTVVFLVFGFHILICNFFAFIISTFNAFFWNNRFVFTNDKNISWVKVLLKTYVAYSFTGLFLSSVLLVIWVQCLGISEYVAPIINLLFTVPINFIINKFWAFASKK